jgi:hypothetical protein
MAGNENSDTRALLRWTIAAVLASWALNLLTFWIAQAQHQDSRELLQVQVGAVLDEEFNSRALRHERGRLALAIHRKEPPDDYRVLQFFDKVGMYMHQGRVDEDTLYEQFSRPVEYYWSASEHYVQGLRKSRHDDLLFANFEELYHQFARRSVHSNGGQARAHTDEDLDHFLDEEQAIGDPPQGTVAGT